MPTQDPKPEPVREGASQVSAGRLNALRDMVPREVRGLAGVAVRYLGDRLGITANESGADLAAPGNYLKQFVVLSEGDDLLLCTPFVPPNDSINLLPQHYDSTLGAGSASYATLYVAKPFALQKTPWDGATVTVNGAAVIYDYTAADVRTSTLASDSTAVTTEKLAPNYMPGDVILAARTMTGYLTSDSFPVVWMDANAAGRRWQKPAGSASAGHAGDVQLSDGSGGFSAALGDSTLNLHATGGYRIFYHSGPLPWLVTEASEGYTTGDVAYYTNPFYQEIHVVLPPGSTPGGATLSIGGASWNYYAVGDGSDTTTTIISEFHDYNKHATTIPHIRLRFVSDHNTVFFGTGSDSPGLYDAQFDNPLGEVLELTHDNRVNGFHTPQTLSSGVQRRFGVGGVVSEHYADAGNAGTAETDLYADVFGADSLSKDGDKITAEYAGAFTSSATATRRLRLYYGGNLFFDSGALAATSAASWVLRTTLVRVSGVVVRYAVTLTQNATLAATSVGELSGVGDLTSGELKVTGQAAGTGAGSNNVVAKLGSVWWWPAAPPPP